MNFHPNDESNILDDSFFGANYQSDFIVGLHLAPLENKKPPHRRLINTNKVNNSDLINSRNQIKHVQHSRQDDSKSNISGVLVEVP
jgi:hypothetical protein